MNTFKKGNGADFIRIAVCDDDSWELLRLHELIDAYAAHNHLRAVCDGFESGVEFLAKTMPGRYDIIFLDIVMPGMNGIETAQELRKLDADAAIVFLTSSREYGAESYEVNALYYALKPITGDFLFSLMDRILHTRQKREQESLLIRQKGSISRIPYAQIEYVEVVDKNVYFHLITGTVWEATGALSAYESQLLGDGRFCKTHRSYLVNHEHVRTVERMEVTMACGAVVPISRNAYALVKKSYLDYLFKRTDFGDGAHL